MPDAFVTMVTFQATGLDKIQSGLKAAQVLQKSITTGAKQYTQELKQTTRQIEAMGRTFRSKEFRDRVRETDTLVRAQERLTKTMERQASLARLMTPAGMAGAAGRGLSIAGGIAGGAAAAGLGMGLAGMQGTVPMARFQNQMDRLQYELGNLLTPYLNIATKATAKAANFLNRQDSQTQNQMGLGLLGGTALLGAHIGSKAAFGMGIGTLAGRTAVSAGRGAMAVGGAAMSGLGALRGGIFGALAAGNMAYGMGGMRGLAGFAGGGILGMGPQAALTAGLGAAGSTIRLNNIEKERRRIQGGDSMGYYDEYAKKFGGLQGDALSQAVQRERGSLLKQGAGIQVKPRGFFGGLLESMMGGGRTQDAGNAQNENEARLLALAQVAGEKPKPKGAADHRANMLVGGDFQEIGAGYYAAASAFAKAGYDQNDAGKDDTSILKDIYDLLNGAIPEWMGGQKPEPNRVQQAG